MRKRIVQLSQVLKRAFKKWLSRDPFRQSSIIAYYAIFALPGLLVVAVTLTGLIFGIETVNKYLYDAIRDAMGVNTADQVAQMIILASKSKESVFATVIGVATILVGATGVFVQLQKSLNIIWEVAATTKKSGLLQLLKMRLFSFGLVISIAFLLLMSLVISSLLAIAGDWIISTWSPSLLGLINIVNFLISFGIITLLFAAMFKVVPDAKIKWRNVWIGAFVTASLFVIGKELMGFYFGKATPGSGYGAAGSIVLILLWTSYSSMIVFFGAEFTKAYANMRNGEIPASEIAVKKKGRQV